MRLFFPDGDGPFPAVIDLHGGAWNRGDLTTCRDRDEALAEAGLVAAAIDFRHAGDGYPTSLVDINYAVRWLKAHAGEYRVDADRVGLSGQSSGGHLAMLAAMRPDDPRYAAIPLDGVSGEFDARVRCVGMSWPVINPLSRYRHAKRVQARAEPPGWVAEIPECHDRYWVTEEAMAEGNPTLALERGEAVETPPALWVQGRPTRCTTISTSTATVDVNRTRAVRAQLPRRGRRDRGALYRPGDAVLADLLRAAGPVLQPPPRGVAGSVPRYGASYRCARIAVW